MANKKIIRLVASNALREHGRSMEFQSDTELGFVGGQFLIMDTGLLKPDGAPLKRCYSIVSEDTEQHSIELAVFDVGEGSRALHGFERQAAVAYSGPWGKLLPTAQDRPGSAWVVATDTGITAALGLVRGQGFRERLSATTLVWLCSPELPFPLEWVEARLPERLGRFVRRELLPVDQEGRCQLAVKHVRTLIAESTKGQAERIASPAGALWLVGDGKVLFGLRDEFGRLLDDQLAENASIECFFNNPSRLSS